MQMPKGDDLDQLRARHRSWMEQQRRGALAGAAKRIERFSDFARSRGVDMSTVAFDWAQAVGVVACGKGIVRSLLGPTRRDRDGLAFFDDLAAALPASTAGCFVGPEFIVMADSCFRRGMHPQLNWAPRFTEIFWELEGVGARSIAIDEDRVRVDVDGPELMELDTWYGPGFNQDIATIPAVVTKLRPPPEAGPRFTEFFFANAHCLDVKWSESGGIKSFQALELKAERARVEREGTLWHPARYLHAEFDLQAKIFRHLDGAIQFLSDQEWGIRSGSDFNLARKSLDHVKPRSRKLFKINGRVQPAVFVELCCQFLHANPLASEYFAGEWPEHVRDAVARLRAGQLRMDEAPDAE
jgi:hypothetical protein